MLRLNCKSRHTLSRYKVPCTYVSLERLAYVGEKTVRSIVLKTADGSLLFFGCKGYQAKEPADGNGVWKCWFGDLNEESPRSRYNKVFADLKAGGLSIPVFNDSPRPDPVQ